MATNGGIIGKSNKASFGKNKLTTQTSTGNLTLQSGTRVVQTAIVAGGGGGGSGGVNAAGTGGGGAGGLRNLEVNAEGTVPITIGAGGAGGDEEKEGQQE